MKSLLPGCVGVVSRYILSEGLAVCTFSGKVEKGHKKSVRERSVTNSTSLFSLKPTILFELPEMKEPQNQLGAPPSLSR